MPTTTRKKKYIRKKKYTRKGGKNVKDLLKIFNKNQTNVQLYRTRKVVNKSHSPFDVNSNVTYNPLYMSLSNRSRSQGSINRLPPIPKKTYQTPLYSVVNKDSNRTIRLKKRGNSNSGSYVNESEVDRRAKKEAVLRELVNEAQYKKAQNINNVQNTYASLNQINRENDIYAVVPKEFFKGVHEGGKNKRRGSKRKSKIFTPSHI